MEFAPINHYTLWLFRIENVNDIVVTWSTMDDVGKNGANVEYGINGLIQKATGTTQKFVDGGAAKRSQYIHRVSFWGKKTQNTENELTNYNLYFFFKLHDVLGDVEKFSTGISLFLPLWQ